MHLSFTNENGALRMNEIFSVTNTDNKTVLPEEYISILITPTMQVYK